MNTTGFSCPWDSGQVGWIYATKQKFRDETGYTEEELFSSDKHRVPKLKEHVKVKGYLLHGTDGWGQVIGIADGKFLVDFDYNKIPSFKKAENVVSASLEEIVEVMSNQAEEMLKGEVETYDDYLTGGFTDTLLKRRKLVPTVVLFLKNTLIHVGFLRRQCKRSYDLVCWGRVRRPVLRFLRREGLHVCYG